jgi:hypothetical protein
MVQTFIPARLRSAAFARRELRAKACNRFLAKALPEAVFKYFSESAQRIAAVGFEPTFRLFPFLLIVAILGADCTDRYGRFPRIGSIILHLWAALGRTLR